MEDGKEIVYIPLTMRQRTMRCFYLISLTFLWAILTGAVGGLSGVSLALAVLLSFHLASLVFGCLMQVIRKTGYSYWYWVDFYLQNTLKKILYLTGISLLLWLLFWLLIIVDDKLAGNQEGSGAGYAIGLLFLIISVESINVFLLISMFLQIGWLFANSQLGKKINAKPFYPFLCWVFGILTLFLLLFIPQYHFIFSLIKQGYFGRIW
jgi:hypothetical protein